MLGRATVVAATAAFTLVIATVPAGAAGPIVPSSAADVDYHAEGQIISGNIHVNTDRAPDNGVALTVCDPDPRPAPNARPDDCAFAEPGGAGDDFLNFGRHIPDADQSPNGAFAPFASAPGVNSRENFNGKAGFKDGGAIFDGHFFDDDDMHFRLVPRTLDAYLAPNGDANNRWRRFCGTGIVEQFNNQGPGGAQAHPPLAPFAAGQVRKFIVEVWDADHRDPSDNQSGNQDYWVIDILKPGSLFDVSNCQNVDDKPNVENPPLVVAAPNPRPAGVTPQAPTAVTGSLPPLVLVKGASVESPRIVGAGARGPGNCLKRSFRVAVNGRNIERVDFSLNGRRVARVTKRDQSGLYRAKISVGDVSRDKQNKVIARVVFRPETGAKARTLPITVRRCARVVKRQSPRFTG